MNLVEEFKKWPFNSLELYNLVFRILLWFAVLIFLFGAVWTFRTYLFVNNAISAQAEIVANSSRDLSEVPIFTFEDQQGKTHKITSSTGYNPPLGRPGDLIDILYDPDDPEIAEENNFRALWAPGYYSLLSGFTNFLTFGAVYLYTKRKLKKRVESVPGELASSGEKQN